MTTLHIDLETRSVVDLRKTGVYVYAEHESTDVWCAAYATDDGPVKLWTPDQPVPFAVLQAVKKNWELFAHNANFERTLWAGVLGPRYGWPVPKLEQWHCTMAMALAMSLPPALENVAVAMKLTEVKDVEGHGLMLRMAKPRKPHKDEDPKALLWWDDDERKQKLFAYCIQDVEVERAVAKRLRRLVPAEQAMWQLDQQINDRGICVDLELCNAALDVVEEATDLLNKELREITDGAVSTATNVNQIRSWMATQGVDTDSIKKETVDELLLQSGLPVSVRRVLSIRSEGALAAVKKIPALIAGRSSDGRARGLLQYHAAGTGRWAGRRFQPQNIKRPEIEDVDAAIDLVRTGSAVEVRRVFDKPISAVADCLRGMVRAAPGHTLYAADFSNIEGRIIAWLADEKTKLKMFEAFDAGTGADIYVITAARILGKDVSEVTKDERQGYGKVPELALGFGGGVRAFQRMAANYDVVFTDEQAGNIKTYWRDAHPNVVNFWGLLEHAGMSAIKEEGGGPFRAGRVLLRVVKSLMFLRLPGGRSLVYPYPCIREKKTPWGEMQPAISYSGVNGLSRKWEQQWAYGGMLFNNVVQGAARDIQAEAMKRLEARGYKIVLTVHDEIVCEVPAGFGSLEEFEALMTVVPAWATGLPVAASAWTGSRYRKG